MPLSADYRAFKPEQESVFDSPMTQAINTFLRWTGLASPQDQVLALMAPMETVDPVGGLVGAIQRVAKKIPNPIKAYHGSPHDFDAFSMEKIGTGEGAQAYGHGLYFAENPAVAQSYRRVGEPPYRSPTVARVAQQAMEWVGGDVAKAKAALQQQYEREQVPFVKQSIADALNNFEQLVGTPPGRMYEVNIHATPDQLLDWDKPLSQQSEQVRQALERLPRAGREAIEASHAPSYLTGRSPQPWTGNTAYRALEDAVYPAANEAGQRTAPYMLREAGIPGIQYLDGGSRTAGEGTRNYVIWDDSVIEILKKYGIALPVIDAMRREAMANGGKVEIQ